MNAGAERNSLQKGQMFPCPHSPLLLNWASVQNMTDIWGCCGSFPASFPVSSFRRNPPSFSVLTGHRLLTLAAIGQQIVYSARTRKAGGSMQVHLNLRDLTALASESLQSHTSPHRAHQLCKATWDKPRGILGNTRNESDA